MGRLTLGRRAIGLGVSLLVAVSALAPSASVSKARVRHPGCRTFFSKTQFARAIGNSPNITFSSQSSTSQVGVLVNGSECGYGWGTPQTGNPDPLNGKIPAIWAVVYNVSPKQWRATRAHEAYSPFEETGPWAQRRMNLGAGSSAFLETTQSTTPPSYYLYVYTRRHDVLWLDVWPAKVSAITSLAQYVLAHDSHFF